MPLTPPERLRRLHYDAKSAGKLQIAVPPGTVIETTEAFAAALQAQDGHFHDVVPAPAELPAPETPEAPPVDAAEPRPRPRKK